MINKVGVIFKTEPLKETSHVNTWLSSITNYMNTLKGQRRPDHSSPEQVKNIIDAFQKCQRVKNTAIAIGCGQTTVKRILLKNGIIPPTRLEVQAQLNPTFNLLHDPSTRQSIALRYKAGESGTDLATEFLTSTSNIRKIAKEFGCLKDSVPNYSDLFEANKNKMLPLFFSGAKISDLAEQYNIPKNALRGYLLKTTGYKVRKKAKAPIPVEDISKISALHNEQNLTMWDIGRLYNCTGPCVADFFDKHNVPRRTKAEAIRLNNHDEELIRKKFKAMASKDPFKLPSGRVVRVMGYEGAFLKFVFANNLLAEEDFNFVVPILSYTQNGVLRKYLPDFHLPKHNAIIEIKSWYIIEKYQGAENLELKKQAVLDKGYNFCLVLDNDFNSFLELIGVPHPA